MIYRAIGLMSGSSLDGLDIVFAEFEESARKWGYTIMAADCYEYSAEWQQKLANAIHLNAYEYQLLHAEYGRYVGEQVNKFIEAHGLEHKVQLIASHGHTTFHAPHLDMTAQLGDGAAIAAVTGINVVSDLRAMDVALGGQGAPIVPMGEKLLFGNFSHLLNIGGIANISLTKDNEYVAFDICPANRVLNMLMEQVGKSYDENGAMAATGQIHTPLLTKLNALDYYKQPFPKSLANDFGVEIVYPLIQSFNLPLQDALRTYVEHIAQQLSYACGQFIKGEPVESTMLVTGGGALNNFLIQRIATNLKSWNITPEVPEDTLVKYKEALIMGLLGILRWREENTVLNSVTGASRSSIGGAVWIGQEA
ncbi:MAG: anhydro-N-acetylmuramic acid kinase [Filimonas sp.]|nr:anhydro-N-acetylmuramic acid kinase [Filimonas sp.]